MNMSNVMALSTSSVQTRNRENELMITSIRSLARGECRGEVEHTEEGEVGDDVIVKLVATSVNQWYVHVGLQGNVVRVQRQQRQRKDDGGEQRSYLCRLVSPRSW